MSEDKPQGVPETPPQVLPVNKELIEHRIGELTNSIQKIEGNIGSIENSISGENGIRVQLATLMERSKHLATKAWILGGVIAGMLAAAGISLAVVKLFWDGESG